MVGFEWLSVVSDWFYMVYENYFTIMNVAIVVAAVYFVAFIVVMLAHGVGSDFIKFDAFDSALNRFFGKHGEINDENKKIFRKTCISKLPFSIKKFCRKCDKKGIAYADVAWESKINRKSETAGIFGIITFFILFLIGVVLLTVLASLSGVGSMQYSSYICFAIISGSIEMVAIAFQLYYLSNKYECIADSIAMKLYKNTNLSISRNKEKIESYYFADTILKKATAPDILSKHDDNVSCLGRMIDNILADGVSGGMVGLLVDGLRSLLVTGYVSPADELRLSCLVHDIENKYSKLA